MIWKLLGAVLVVGAIGFSFMAGKALGQVASPAVLDCTAADANMLHSDLLVLEKNGPDALRELVNLRMAGDVQAMCLLLNGSTPPGAEQEQRVRAVLKRIGGYRASIAQGSDAKNAAELWAQPAVVECLEASRQ
jgi:hypothetical protein